MSVAGKHDSLFAVNVPVVSPTGGAESDLRRLTAADFRAAAPDADIQVVGDVSEMPRHAAASAPTGDGGAGRRSSPAGPAVARVVLFLVSRAHVRGNASSPGCTARPGPGAGPDPMRVRPARWLTPLWLAPLAVVAS